MDTETIAAIGGFLPRQCGIATFTTDLTEALAAEYPEAQVFALPMNDRPEGYDYPERVRFEIDQHDLASYRRAADFLNLGRVDVVSLQHEFGIYGGIAGGYVLSLMREIEAPIVTTLHTILKDPEPRFRQVMRELIRLSDRLVVMSARGRDMLRDIYGAPEDKVDVIHHGIPDVPFSDSAFFKDRFGVEGRTTLLTFGLLSRGKGLEYVIQALPRIVAEWPDVVYMIVGATHPHVVQAEGESYREELAALAERLGVTEHVRFYNKFVDLDELNRFIGAADVYVTPYLNPEQITSGTLAYTLGAGKAIVSTPYWYAEELLAEGRGVLVPFRDPDALAEGIVRVLADDTERNAMRKRAYVYGREMVWAEVARRYRESFERSRERRSRLVRRATVPALDVNRRLSVPPLTLSYLERLTDDTGLLRHATFTVPNYASGYSTDDNARGLVVATLYGELEPSAEAQATRLSSRYLAFLSYALDPSTGRFHNLMGFDRHWRDEVGSEDAHGRALWGLGTVVERSQHKGLRGLAARLFNEALPAVDALVYPHAWAFALLGLHGYLRSLAGDRLAHELRERLAGRLLEAYRTHSTPDWPWFADDLTHNNAALPHALLVAGRALEDQDMRRVALDSLEWLAEIQRSPEGLFVPIGSQGVYRRNGERTYYDQQPNEAGTMVLACLEAYDATRRDFWRRQALRAFEWFLGRNQLALSVYDPTTGGCRDGLHPDRINENQGAEATLAFLHAALAMRSAERVTVTEEVGYALQASS